MAKASGDKFVAAGNVYISELAGTSAGGISSTLAVGSLNIKYQSLQNAYKLADTPPKRIPMFDTLVQELKGDTHTST